MTNDWLDTADSQMDAEVAAQEKRASATTWKPSEGDTIKGILIDGDYVSTKHGDTHVLTVEDPDGKVWTVWCSAVLLLDAVVKLSPKIGKGISVKFDGKKPPKVAGGYEWNAYYMTCEESDAPYWHEKRTGLQAKAELEQAELMGGSGLAADTADTDPFI